MLPDSTGRVDAFGRLVVLHDDVLKSLLGNRQSLLDHDQAVPRLFELPPQKSEIVDHAASLRPPSPPPSGSDANQGRQPLSAISASLPSSV